VTRQNVAEPFICTCISSFTFFSQHIFREIPHSLLPQNSFSRKKFVQYGSKFAHFFAKVTYRRNYKVIFLLFRLREIIGNIINQNEILFINNFNIRLQENLDRRKF